MPTISVITAVYNVAEYLPRMLDALLAQTVSKEMEVLLIDDGSTDESGRICDQYAQDHPELFRCFHQQNAGLSAVLNRGLDLARGEFVGIADGDDWIEPDMYETLLNNARAFEAPVSLVSGVKIYPNGSRQKLSEDTDGAVLMDGKQAMRKLLERKIYCSVCFGLFRKEALAGQRFDESQAVAMDKLFIAQCFLRFDRIAFDGSVKYHYYRRWDSLIGRGFTPRKMHDLRAMHWIYEHIFPKWPDLEGAYWYHFAMSVYYILGDFCVAPKTRGQYREEYRTTLREFRTIPLKKIRPYFTRGHFFSIILRGYFPMLQYRVIHAKGHLQKLLKK